MSYYRYYVINFDEIKVLSGLVKKDRTYDVNKNIYEGIDKRFIAYYGKIFLRSDNIFSETPIEIVTKRKFSYNMNGSKWYFYSKDKALITTSYYDLDHFKVDDEKGMIKFFQEMKSQGKYKEYFDSIELLFKNIDKQKALIENGYGRVEDSIDIDDYMKGVEYDAVEARKLKR